MDKPAPGRWVVPNPRICRTFALLNIIFGGLMLMVGIGYAVWYFVAPSFIKQMQAGVRAQLAEQKAEHQAKIDEIKQKEKSAKNAEEKEKLQAEREDLEAEEAAGLDFAGDLSDWNIFSDPRARAFYAAETGSGILLNLFMIISGAGLLALSEWARRLGIWVACFKIARWVVIVIVTLVVIVPITTEKTQSVVQKVQMQGATKGGVRVTTFPMSSMAQFTAIATAVTTIFGAVMASIYPALAIWFLTRPSARAACLAKQPIAPPTPGFEQGELR
jgi:hypothetical protein